ncbi:MULTISPECIES: HAMP domain-containing sensor histidine kinase [unclassified Bradyrhizobium]|uniref:sensor histidine kinase n=1 Tax=unclassified Bradyrhizobium TaxID=2631580 RepID=UPI0028E8DB95|nr:MULTISPECIES: HAMP domain-containing sensor histidine kinase [unclassified Bradyrhizobium]
MKSIARTFTLSLGLAATAIFLATITITVWQSQLREYDPVVCRVAAGILYDAAVVDPGHALTIRSTRRVEELKSFSPNLWYVVSYEKLITEYGGDRRPALPFSLPYGGPIGFSVLNTLDQNATFCLAVINWGPSDLVMMVGGAQVHFGQMLWSFVGRNVFPLSLGAFAFASMVMIGAWLSGRFVGRGIDRVTRRALAIDPSAPQGSIALDEVPIELKPLVEALNRAFDEINAYIKMQRRFLGNAAHQLRTPLTLLRARIEDVAEPQLRSALVRDMRRLTSLVAAMLDLARLQNHAIEKRPIDLAEMARDALADFGPSALDAGIELSLEQAEKNGTVVQGVEAAVRSALANLVGNALIHAGGVKRVTATFGRGSVSISDDGAGFSPGYEPNFIEPFQTGNAAEGGAGLGLSIVHEIMAAHGGAFIITSTPSGGTTATLRFAEAAAATPNEDKPGSVETA